MVILLQHCAAQKWRCDAPVPRESQRNRGSKTRRQFEVFKSRFPGTKFNFSGFSFRLGCITDASVVKEVLHGCHVVMHFAGLKAVGESSERPLDYYRVNVGGTVNLLKVSAKHGAFCTVTLK